MKKTSAAMLFISAMLLSANAAFAEPPQISGADTMHSVLTAQKGKQVTVKLAAGDELTGKVGAVTEKLVLLQTLSGKEYFDAVVDMEDVAAVIIRNRE